MVRSYNDAVKQESRAKLKGFVKKNLLSHMSPRDVRVVCFPGAEVDGEEALEVKEVYDSLGIPRENVMGIEYDAKNHERLKNAGLGIRFTDRPMDAYDFFKTTSEKFDVISLDYTGQRTWKERDIARYIAGKGLLGNGGIYCTNHSANREGVKMKKGLLSVMREKEALESMKDMMPLAEDNFLETVVGEGSRILDKYDEMSSSIKEKTFDLNLLRDQIARDNVEIFRGGVLEVSPHENIFARSQIFSEIVECYRKDLGKELSKRKFGVLGEDYGVYKMAFRDFLSMAESEFVRSGVVKKDVALKALHFLNLDFNKGYAVRNIERYSYTSNKNTNMLLDIMEVKRLPDMLAQNVNKIISLSPDGQGMKYNPCFLSPKAFRGVVSRVKRVPSSWIDVNIPAPIYLGSSWVPPKRKKKISKEKAVELMRDGISPRALAEEYSGFTKGQLAAFKAHITMGTY